MDSHPPAAQPADGSKKPARLLSRRRLLKVWGSFFGAGAALGLYTWRIEPHWVQVVARDLPIRGLPPSLDGRTLLQLSDLHIGPVVDTDYITRMMSLASSLEPDMIAITGDFMSAWDHEQIDLVARVLGKLKLPPLGCFAILGNHDYGYNWSQADVADRLVKRLGELGISVLRNERQMVEGLQLVGLDDLWGPNFDAVKTFNDVDWSGPTLTLCHNPDAVDRSDFRVCRGWVLAGHSHGGQCKPPFLPPPMLPVKNRRYTRGEFDVGEGRTLYINRGLGYLRRVRFNVRPEITAFRLTPA